MANKNILNIKFDKLPVWRGTIKNYCASIETAPIEIIVNDCGYYQQIIEPKNFKKIVDYSASDYSFLSTLPGKSNWGNSRAKFLLEFILSEIQDVAGKNILDIGGGSTYIMEKLVRDHRAKGGIIVDPAIKENPDNPKIHTIKKHFSCDLVSDFKIDIIVCFACFEHLLDPLQFLENINLLAKKNKASVLLVFPDTKRQFSKGDVNSLLHEHVSYFSAKSAKKLFAMKRFSIKSIKSENDNLFCHIYSNGAENNKSDEETDEVACLQNFTKQLNYISGDLNNLLITEGGKVAFHGATNGLNNTLFLTGFQGHPNIFIYDGDEAKVDRYLPTCVNPIRHSSEKSYNDFKNIYISAVSFYEECFNFLNDKYDIKNIKSIIQ